MRYSILLQQKTQRGDCKRYSLSIENTEKEKPYITLEGNQKGKQLFLKTTVILKFVFQLILTTALYLIVNELEKTWKYFFWKHPTPKIKYETLCNDYEVGGSTNVDIPDKVWLANDLR